jgi:hypothetical protein
VLKGVLALPAGARGRAGVMRSGNTSPVATTVSGSGAADEDRDRERGPG